MESTGPDLLLGMGSLQVLATQSHGMGQNGSLEVVEPINSRIHPMESTGLSRNLEMAFLQKPATHSLGTAHDGWLEAKEQIL
jgi:hypothetical protein